MSCIEIAWSTSEPFVVVRYRMRDQYAIFAKSCRWYLVLRQRGSHRKVASEGGPCLSGLYYSLVHLEYARWPLAGVI